MPQQFYATNCIGTNTLAQTGVPLYVVAPPTNAPYALTNGAGWLTGVPVNIANYDRVGFFFECYIATNVTVASSNLSVTLVRSQSSGYPTNIVRTNQFSQGQLVTSYSDWESSSNATAIVLQIPIPAAPFTNYFVYHTNLEPWQVGGANWLGIHHIFGGGTNMFLTNVIMGINGKAIYSPDPSR